MSGVTNPDITPPADTPTDPAPPAPPPIEALTSSPGERFLDVFARVAGWTFGIVLGSAAALALAIAIIGGLASGGLNDVLDQNQYQDRLDAIDAVYRQGVKARQTLARNGLTAATEAACKTAMRQVGAHKERSLVQDSREIGDERRPDVEFARLRELSFINGCMGRPNDLPAIPLPTD